MPSHRLRSLAKPEAGGDNTRVVAAPIVAAVGAWDQIDHGEAAERLVLLVPRLHGFGGAGPALDEEVVSRLIVGDVERIVGRDLQAAGTAAVAVPFELAVVDHWLGGDSAAQAFGAGFELGLVRL